MFKMPEDGILLIDKPTGMTSFGVVARIRRVLSKQIGKKAKVGHTGTLDPFASGLMILVLGRECRNAGHYTKLDKSYEAEIILGEVSSTGDPEGEIISREVPVVPTIAEIEAVLDQFRGEISQTPPIYSAIKIGGERAYKLARDGKTIDMPSRQVNIYDLQVLDYQFPSLRVKTSVSSGTYIRSLAIDIGETLGLGAYCRGLRRLTVGEWSVEKAKSLKDYGIDS